MLSRMDLIEHLCAQHGFFTYAEAQHAGYDKRSIAAVVRAGLWLRVRRGYYVPAADWARLDEVGRHRVRSRMVLRSLGSAVALSHVSAAVAHGLTTWGLALDRVHVTRLDGASGRLEGDVVHHEGVCAPADVVLTDDGACTSPVRAALEAASQGRGGASLTVLDSLLHHGLATPDELMDQFVAMQHWPHVRHLHVPVRMADGAADGAGESRGRWLFWAEGLPAPVLQFAVHDAAGAVVGTSDWAWPDEGLLGEFDGRVKYGRLLRPGQAPGDAVFAEKRREDRLRELTGFAMVRLVWEDLARPRATADRIRRLLGRRAG